MNETSVIDFYRLINKIDVNQIRFTIFLSIYRLINRYRFLSIDNSRRSNKTVYAHQGNEKTQDCVFCKPRHNKYMIICSNATIALSGYFH